MEEGAPGSCVCVCAHCYREEWLSNSFIQSARLVFQCQWIRSVLFKTTHGRRWAFKAIDLESSVLIDNSIKTRGDILWSFFAMDQ